MTPSNQPDQSQSVSVAPGAPGASPASSGAAKAPPRPRGRVGLARFDELRREHYCIEYIGGVDEAGRGALAGPVVAACVVFAPGAKIKGVNDSKQLSHAEREALVPQIIAKSAAWSVGWATAAEVDTINVLQATIRAAYRAIERLTTPPQYLITDFLKLTEAPCAYEAIVDGDAQSQCVAAASVLAKVARDRIMIALARAYPRYGFARHKGYGTPEHWAALNTIGPSTLHRLSYNGVTFFDVIPGVRAEFDNSTPWNHTPTPHRPHPTLHWHELYTTACEEIDVRHYLPECEFERILRSV